MDTKTAAGQDVPSIDWLATWRKGCKCQGLSDMPMIVGSTTSDLTGDKFSISISDFVPPECQKCGMPWEQTLS